MGFLNDIVNGKEKKVKADPLAGDINAAGKIGLQDMQDGGASLRSLYAQDPTQLVNNQIGIENKMIRGASDDATRRTRDMMAARGMGGSSIGLGQEVNQRKSLLDKLSMNSASVPGRIRDMQLQNAQGTMDVGNTLLAPKLSQGVQMQDQKYRTGGYGQLIGAGLQGGIGLMGK